MSYGELSNTQETMVLPMLQMKNIRGKPYITVSAKGIANGLSNIPNDGADFGPDTTLNATAPGQYGSPYTETVGINEAGSYLSKAITSANGVAGGGGKIVLVDSLTYQISAPIVIDAYSGSASFSVTIEGVAWKRVGTQICPSSSFPSDSYLLTINGGSGSLQAGFILKNFVFNGQKGGGFGGTPYASGFLVQNGNYGTIDSVSYENCVVGRNFSITTGGTQQISGFAANNEIFENYTTGIINEYGGVTTVNPSFYPNSNTSVAIQEQGMQNVEYINPLLICSVYPVFMRVYINGNRAIKISNLFYYGTYPSSGNYPIIQSYSTNENYQTIIYIDGITLNASNPSTATTQLIQTVDNTGANQGGYFFISKFNPILDTLLILDNTIDTFVHLILSDAYLSNLTTLNFSTGSSSDNFLYFYNCIGLPAPTLSTNPPVSGTTYQNTNPFDIRLKIPVTYSPTSSAAATLATGTSSTSTVTTSTKVSYPAGITTGIINTYEMVVPAGQYFELVVANATIGTVEVQAA